MVAYWKVTCVMAVLIIFISFSEDMQYWCWKLPRLLCLGLFQVSASIQVVFKWLHLTWTIRQLPVHHHATGWWCFPWLCMMICRVDLKMAPFDVISFDSFYPPFCSFRPPPVLMRLAKNSDGGAFSLLSIQQLADRW